MRFPHAKYFILAGLLLMFYDARVPAKGPGDREKQNYRSISRYIGSLNREGESGTPAKGRIVFFIRFVDFGCTICFNNFLEFCGSLKSSGEVRDEEVLLIVLRDKSSEARQRSMLKKWAGANDLPFPIFLEQEEIFDSCGIGHSTVVVLNKQGGVDLAEELPLSTEIAGILLAYLRVQ